MEEPIAVKVDPEVDAGYVRYRRLAAGERVARTRRFGDDVNVDYNAVDDVLGIELLAFDDSALDVARAVAADHGLVFPPDIAGAGMTRRRKA